MDTFQFLNDEPNGLQKEINIAAELGRSVVNGPGVRYVLWVQGCPFRCSGCYNQDFLPFIEKDLVTVEYLAERILSTRGIEGVTYSGGEPMAQPEGLYYLSRILKSEGLTAVCYSGFTLEELRRRKNPFVAKLLGALDILIDGRYDQSRKANLLWRGSSNQKVHFLSDVYSDYESKVGAPRTEMELVIGESGVTYTGILQQKIMARLEKVLKEGLADERHEPDAPRLA